MPREAIVISGPGATIGQVRCSEARRGWSAEEPVSTLAIVLVRGGLFQRRVNGREHLADAMAGYVQRPGSVQQIAHPAGGDLCTLIAPTPAMLGSLAEQAQALDPLLVSPAADLDHQMLIARARAGAEAFELAERAVVLAGLLLEAAARPTPRPGRGSFERRARLVDDARQAVAADIGLRLDELAGLMGVSAYHLSRTFRRLTGQTLSRYRLRLRLHRAMERLAAGDRDLAGVAAESGFADQAHLTRALREETGFTPGAVRRVLTGPDDVLRAR